MKNTYILLKSSSAELKNTKSLTLCAMLVAVSIVLGHFSIYLTPAIRISFALIPVAIVAYLFGPVVGATIGGTVDIINFILNPVAGFSPGFTLSSILTGLIFGLFLYKKPVTIKRMLLCNIIINLFINLCLNTLWLTLLNHTPYMVNFYSRIPKEVIMIAINTILLYTLTKSLKNNRLFNI